MKVNIINSKEDSKGLKIVVFSIGFALLISSLLVFPLIREKEEKITYDLRYNKFTDEYSIKLDTPENAMQFFSENNIDLKKQGNRFYYEDSYKLSKDMEKFKVWIS